MVSSGGSSLPALQTVGQLLCPYVAGGRRESEFSGVSSDPALMASSKRLPKAPSPSTITLKVRASTYDFWGLGGHSSVHSRKYILHF